MQPTHTLTEQKKADPPGDRAAESLPRPAPDFDYGQAALEGWTVSECEPQRDGTPRDAWDHVVAWARAGSELHLQALQLVDTTERALIEKTCGSW
jgi:hypothetical protein